MPFDQRRPRRQTEQPIVLPNELPNQMPNPLPEQMAQMPNPSLEQVSGPPKIPEKKRVRRKVRPKGAAILALCFMLLLAGIFVVIDLNVMCLRSVTINGLISISQHEVQELTGLTLGARYLSVVEETVQTKLENDGRIKFISLEKHFPNTVVLNVKERQKRANLVVMGVMYILDEEGMVLEKTSDVNTDNGLITVTGMQVREARKGRMVVAQKSSQLEAYTLVLEELTQQQCVSEFSQINLAQTDHIYLTTTNNSYTVDIGTATDDLRAKIGTVRAVINELRRMEYTGGLVDATVPGEATYSPQSR